MALISDIPTVSHAIQQAVAPVFLLTGVGSLLGVLVNRLGRVVDRHRALSSAKTKETNVEKEMHSLQKRSQLIHQAIRFCTWCALLICMAISALFIGVELGSKVSWIVALLFVLGMFSLTLGLICFLKEISLATSTIESPQ